MPKSIKEIASFNLGTLFNVSEKDAPLEAAAFSLNVNPIAEDGVLDAINAHKLVVSVDKLNEISFAYPITWGSDGVFTNTTGYNSASPVYNKSSVVIENIQAADNQSQCTIRLEGVKGRKELLRLNTIEPWVEKTMATSTLPIAYIPTAAFNIEDTYIDYLSNTNEITSSAGVTNVTFDGFTDNEATIEVNSVNAGNELDADEFVVTTPDGTIKTYLFDDDNDGATGTTDGDGKVRIQITGLSAHNTITAQVKAAIEHANGHNGKISVIQTDGQVEGVDDLTPTVGESNLSAVWTASADYVDIQQISTTGSGTGCIIDVTTSAGGEPTVVITDKGSGYANTNTITFNEPIAGADLVTNGNMEIDDNWATLSGAGTNEQSTTEVYSGTYSRKFISDAAYKGIQSDTFTTVTDKSYTLSFWVYPSISSIYRRIRKGDDSAYLLNGSITGLTPNAWNFVSETVKETAGGSGAYLHFASPNLAGTWYIDDVMYRKQETLTLTIDDISSKLALTDEHGSLEKYFEVGDYMSFAATGGSAYTGRTNHEFLQIEDIDTAIYRIYFKRMCFGTLSNALAASTSYDIYSNKLTIDSIQFRTSRGVGKLHDWSNYSGNHIGGNSKYYFKVDGTDDEEKKSVGIINASTYNVVFSNSAKTMTFTAPFSFVEQDTITIWGSVNDVINSGKSFKVLKIDGNIVHLDSAPTDGTISSGTVYIETNLLKNHTFHHSVDTVDETSSLLGPSRNNKVNKWTHYAYSNNSFEGDATYSNIYVVQTSTDVVHDVNGGGYWEDTTAGHGDLAASYYPCNANDAFMIIESEYHGNQNEIANTSGIDAEDTHIICDGNIEEQFSANDIILIQSEYMRVTSVNGVNLFVERAIMGATGSGEANIAATHAKAQRIQKCFNNGIRQDVSNSLLNKKQAYNLTFFAKEDTVTAVGALSLRFGPGYFGKDGVWIENSNNPEQGIANRIVQQEDRWIAFEDLDRPDGDISDGNHGLDSTWRKFSQIFYIPKDVEFTSSNADLIVEFASRGLDGSKIGIDLVDLREHSIALIKKYDMIAPSSSGFINNSGIKDLIIYDKEDEDINVIPGFKLDQSKLLRPTLELDKSSFASERTKSTSGEVVYTPKNRETHIGFGSGAEDSPPQWLGYVNSKIFDEDTTNRLYQDEDTIHQYDAGSTTSLSKVCVAGEHEHLISYWNLSGTFDDGQNVALAATTLRIYHAAHSMNIGDNIVTREWEDVSNSWDGRGVWVVTAIQTDYFDCKRFNTLDLNPLEEGCFSIASTATSGATVTINCGEDHGLRIGDKVVISDTTTFNGTKTVTGITDDDTFTFTETLTNNNETGNATKQFRLCYRPYYYYGIKEGDSSIYRISPDTRIAGSTNEPDTGDGSIALDASGNYVAGTIERSVETTKVIGSITTCYNKKTDGTGGGMIYILSSDATDYKDTKITAIDVQVAYNKWTINKLDEILTFAPKFKAFKWSNDSTNGNINTGTPESTTADSGTVRVFGSIASSSSPSIKAAGIPSDIIETKGPNHTYDSKATTNTINNPSMFDTRLWLQFRPGGNESFSEGDRFLFAGRTEDWHFNGGNRRLYLADRTPPTTTVFGKEVRYGMGDEKFRSGPGVHPKDGDNDNKHKKLGNSILKKYAYYWHALGKKGQHRDYLKKIAPIRDGKGSYWGDTLISADLGKHPYFHFGYNVGWDGEGGKFPAIKVPKYGLVPMLDNDHDGIIDGTGLVVPSLKTLPDQVNGIRMGPYGNYHQRVCAHAVGLVATSDRPWVRHWGKLMDFADASHFVSGNTRSDKWPDHMDAPENMKADKMLMISSDVHYGDYQPRWQYNITAIATNNSTDIDAYNNMIKITTSSYGSSWDIGRTMQAGDMVYLEALGYNKPCHIVRILSSTEVVLSLKHVNNHSGTCTLYPFTRKPFKWFHYKKGPFTYSGIPSGDKYRSFHWAYDDKNNKSGARFTKKNQAAGHFVKNWWTAPTSFGFSYGSPAAAEMQAPGLLNRIEKLNFRAGYMIRPFDKNTSTFIGLQCSDGTVVSIASAPDSVYHQKNGSYIHYNVGTATKALSNNIRHNSKLHIADDTSGTKYSRLFLADTSFVFPDKKHSVEIQKTTSKEKTHAFNDYPLYKPLFAGKISWYYNTSTGTFPNGENCPVIQITGNTSAEIYYNRTLKGRYLDSGVWVGASISIRDQETGIIQTRQIVESRSTSTKTYLHVHYPFAHAPANDDEFWVWKHAYVCTAPLKLYRETSLGLGLGRAYKETTDRTPFVSSHAITSTSVSSSVLSLTSAYPTNFSVGDKVAVTDTDSYDGIYDVIIKTNPNIIGVTYTGAATSDETGIVKNHVSDSVNSNHNGIKIEIDRPLLHTMFGGLDLRKSFSYITEDTIVAGSSTIDSLQDNQMETDIDNNFQIGDMLQINSTAVLGAFDVVASGGADKFTIFNTSNTVSGGAGTADNIWWESLIASQTGAAKLGKINQGYFTWGTGREDGNILRSDRYSDVGGDTTQATDDDIYMSTGETVIDIQASSEANQAGYFKANNIYRYKISLIYDGYQEGLLSSGTWEYQDTDGRDSLDITLQIKEYSNRLTHFCIYRKDTKNALYKLVKEVKTDTGWEYDDEKWSYTFEDEGNLGATYEARTALSEILDTIQIKYGMSTEIDGYLFVGNCGHEKIENAENLIFRSKPGRFSTFDYVNDFIQLKSKPTAMANFLGRLFIFDDTNIYKINQETLAIEDIFEGIGCIGKDSITITEHGMFFADRNGAYVHNGTAPQKISDTIFQSGGTDTAFGGTDNIKDISWSNTGGNILARPPYVVYDSIIESVLFFVEYLDKEIGSGGEIKHLKSNYIWSFNIKKQRWDLWELDNDSELGVPFAGDKGEILVPIDNGIYEVRGSGKKMDYTWMSKKLKLEGDSISKVYNKIKINGIENNINLNGSYKESSDRLLVQTNVGAVSTSDIIYRSKDTGNSTYKLSGSSRKGRWMQFKLEDMTEPIDSIGIIYRLRAVK